MKITVVTPSFNQGKYLEETIRSVISQEGDFLIDYIIMDGGSTDESKDIISRYDRMLQSGEWEVRCGGIEYRWVSRTDKGQVDAIIQGFAMARGDVLCWLNSDDIYPNAVVLARVASLFREDDALDMLTADGYLIDEKGGILGLHHVDRLNMKELLFLDYHILQPATFIRSRIYNAQLLDMGYVCAFDADFFIGLLRAGVRCRKTDDVLACFRIYPEIKTNNLASLRYREQMQIAWKYSKNIVYFLLSAWYRYVEIILRKKCGGHRLYARLFEIAYKVSYRLITGKASYRLFGNNA
jgi:glycosyltransferase involved in cell wall biosynthesis